MLMCFFLNEIKLQAGFETQRTLNLRNNIKLMNINVSSSTLKLILSFVKMTIHTKARKPKE